MEDGVWGTAVELDLSRLSPAPWRLQEECPEQDADVGVFAADGKVVTLGDVMACVDLAFIALARNAFNVMVRRGWGLGFSGQEGPMQGWLVLLPKEMYPLDHRLYPLANLRATDPFTALVEADKWYRENCEQQP